ncbi:hypothetical protein [Thermoflexus sp.]|nr:hypothetical protein [Thermoflexus sp.]
MPKAGTAAYLVCKPGGSKMAAYAEKDGEWLLELAKDVNRKGIFYQGIS